MSDRNVFSKLLPPSPFRLSNAQETQKLGKILGRSLPPGQVICLLGDLGAGKTTFVQGVGSGLGIVEPIVSPTFTLINEYLEGRVPLYHFDLYRIQSSQIDSLAPELYWEGIEITPGITIIEWAERLSYKPLTYLEITILHSSESGREFRWCWHDQPKQE